MDIGQIPNFVQVDEVVSNLDNYLAEICEELCANKVPNFTRIRGAEVVLDRISHKYVAFFTDSAPIVVRINYERIRRKLRATKVLIPDMPLHQFKIFVRYLKRCPNKRYLIDIKRRLMISIVP